MLYLLPPPKSIPGPIKAEPKRERMLATPPKPPKAKKAKTEIKMEPASPVGSSVLKQAMSTYADKVSEMGVYLCALDLCVLATGLNMAPCHCKCMVLLMSNCIVFIFFVQHNSTVDSLASLPLAMESICLILRMSALLLTSSRARWLLLRLQTTSTTLCLIVASSFHKTQTRLGPSY